MDQILTSWPTLILLGLGLRMALRLHYGARGPEIGDPVYDFLAIVSWVLISLGLIPAILGSIFTLFGAIIFILAATTLHEVVTQRRASQRRSICALLALFIDRKMHLDAPTLFSTYAMRGSVGRAARRLFTAVQTGMPLAEAVRRNRRALPREAIAYIASGQTVQCEAAALKELGRDEHVEISAVTRAVTDRLSYLGGVFLVLIAVLTFTTIKIVPAYSNIFQEFQVELPAMTQFTVVASHAVIQFLDGHAALVTVILFALIALCLTIVVCDLLDMPILRGLGDRVFRDRRKADVLRILAVAAEQRQPLPPVLYRLAELYPSAPLRAQLSPVAQAAMAGGPWHGALGKYGVVSGPEAALLKSAEQTGNVAWALREIAARREKRAVYRLSVALQVLYPIVILLLGGLVGFYVVSLFLPVVRLIQSLT